MSASSATPLYLLLSFLLFSPLLYRPTFATKRVTKRSYVVYLGAHSRSFEASPIDLNQVRDTHYAFLGSCLGRSYIRYNDSFMLKYLVEHARVETQTREHFELWTIERVWAVGYMKASRRVAHFPESRGMIEDALEVATDHEGCCLA